MRWRKATWAIIIWTALCAYWLFDSLLIDPPPSIERYGGFAIFFTALAVLSTWFIGLLVLTIVWLLSRPKPNTHIYGPQGQWMTVTEREAKRRVEQEGWSYTPPMAYPPQGYLLRQSPRLRPPPPPGGPGQPQG